MNVLKQYGIAIVAISLTCSLALPLCYAQTRVLPPLLPSESSGAYLGIQMDDVTAGNLSKYKLNSERGVIVRSIVKGSPAEAANIKEEDVILEFGGYQVWSSLQLSRLVRETPAGRKVDLVVSRDGKRINLSAKLEMREGIRAENQMEMPPREFSGPGQRSFQFRWPDIPNSDPGSPSGNKPRLGVTIQPLTEQLGEFLGVPNKKGVLISGVIEGSPSSGKLKPGDVIISADGKNTEGPEDLTRLIRDKSEGSVTLKVIRDKKELSVVINLPTGDEKGFKL